MGKRTHRWTPPHLTPADPSPERPRGLFTVPPGSPEACRWRGCSNIIRHETLPLCSAHIRLVDERLQAERDSKAATEASIIQKIEDGIRLEPDEKAPGHIYYAQIDGLIKIGYAKSVRARMRQYPPTTKLLAVEPGTRKTEYARHMHFAEHLAQGREWFRDVPELRTWINTLVTEYGPADRFAHVWGRYEAPPVVGGKRITNRRR